MPRSDGRWTVHERLVCARVLARLGEHDPTRVGAAVLRGVAELLLDAQRWDEAELVRSCARALERGRTASR